VHQNGGLDMKGFWYTMTMLSAMLIFLVLPIAYFFYETEGDTYGSRIWHMCKMEFFFLIGSSILVFVTYPLLSKADVPIRSVD